MFFKLTLSCCLVLLAFPAGAEKQQPVLTSLDMKAMDRKVNPCDDLYLFANGGWLKSHSIPAYQTRWGAFEELREKTAQQLISIAAAAAAAKNAPQDSALRKVGDFYASGMDVKQIEADGLRPLRSLFEKINGIDSQAQLVEVIASLHQQWPLPTFRSGSSPFFTLYARPDPKNSKQVIVHLWQSGLGLPDRDYYLKSDPRSVALRTDYEQHVVNMFKLLGEEVTATQNAKTVLLLETGLAQAASARVKLRDPQANYNKMSLSELIALAPQFDWARYFAALGVTDTSQINVGQPEFIKAMAAATQSQTVEQWKTYLRWHLVHTMAAYLPTRFAEEDFSFYEKNLRGALEPAPRAKRIAQLADEKLGEVLGQLYVAKYFSSNAKIRAQNLVEQVKSALRSRLENLDWMSQETRIEALRKLNAMQVKIGYPDRWQDHSGLNISRRPLIENVLSADTWRFRQMMAKVGQPTDRSEWRMTPSTVNAYYNPSANEIVFPAGILQAPFFFSQGPDALNYGAIGMVIGHEITHGFDDSGRQYDADGNLRNWWKPEDEQRYRERAARIVAQYNQYQPLADLAIDGELTVGENIADIGGLKIAYLAFQQTRKAGEPTLRGLKPEQQFFAAFAQVWRDSIRAERLRLNLRTDPHSPALFRVKGSLVHLPEFRRAFNCAAADAAASLPGIW